MAYGIDNRAIGCKNLWHRIVFLRRRVHMSTFLSRRNVIMRNSAARSRQKSIPRIAANALSLSIPSLSLCCNVGRDCCMCCAHRPIFVDHLRTALLPLPRTARTVRAPGRVVWSLDLCWGRHRRTRWRWWILNRDLRWYRQIVQNRW